jgi:competence protein ComFC
MNSGIIELSIPCGDCCRLKHSRITGPSYNGYALSPHVEVLTAQSGAHFSRRTTLAETMYRYRYQRNDSLLLPIAECFASAIRILFTDQQRFNGLIMVPPPLNRSDYNPVVTLITEISRISGIPSLQFAVRDVQDTSNRQTGSSGRSFVFTTTDTAAVFTGKRILVIDDIYRSGTSLDRFCSLIRQNGRAREVNALVGTIMGKSKSSE